MLLFKDGEVSILIIQSFRLQVVNTAFYIDLLLSSSAIVNKQIYHHRH